MMVAILNTFGYALVALFLAALLPVGLIITREELRKVRLRLVQELSDTLFREQRNLPQLQLVTARYAAPGDSNSLPDRPRGQPRSALVKIWAGAGFFIAVNFIGFLILTLPRDWLLSAVPSFPRVSYALLWSSPGPLPPPAGSTLAQLREMAQRTELAQLRELAQSLTVLGFAFLGAYIFQLRYLTRATLNHELGALAFVRATLHIVQGMAVALVFFRAAEAAAPGVGTTGWFAAAIGGAFVSGMYPNLGLVKLAKHLRVRAKLVDEDALAAAKLIPLEVIDGIDAETAFRLEESNLYDVQNLAAINPIELYAESPFSLMEIFDWVLQAQLCANVGTRAFAMLKHHKVRTIFDLERAVLAHGAPDSYIRALGAIIFHDATPLFTRRLDLRLDTGGGSSETGLLADVNPLVVKHAVAIMVDDLHVHRLRALWRMMLESTAGLREGQSPWLYVTEPLPGESDFGLPRLSVPAEAWVQFARERGRAYQDQQKAGATPETLKDIRGECIDAAGKAISLDALARERLRLYWYPQYLRKQPDEGDLQPFADDPEFVQLLGTPTRS